MGTLFTSPARQRDIVERMIAAIADGRPAYEIRRLALRATAPLDDPRRASDLFDGVAAVLRLIEEAPRHGWPVELLKQQATDAAWRIARASEH